MKTCSRLLALALAALLSGIAFAQTNLVTNPGFETAVTIDGVPTVFASWGGDQNSVVAGENGIVPIPSGTKMLKFVHTSPSPLVEGTGSDVIQLINLSAFSSQIAAGTAKFRLSASFNRIAGDVTTDTRFEVKIGAYSGLPSAFTDSLTPLATSTAALISDANTATWEALFTDLVMPAGTTYAAIWISAVENVTPDPFTGTEFAGHYADNVAFVLLPTGGLRSLINSSTMASAGGAGPAALATHFIIEGSTPKTVLVRAIGPTLAAAPFNLAGTMADPAVVIYNGFGQRVAENDNWGSAATSPALASAFTTVGAFALADGSRDAALLATLTPGVYTARVDGASGGTGSAMIEVYDADTNSRVAHFSTQLRVATAGATVVTGFVVSGTVAQTFLIRAIGPALSSAGVTGTLGNPAISLFSGSANLASNDNWGTAASNPNVASAAATAGLRPLADGSNDAALLVTLAPGSYTLQLTGTGSTTGNALVEVAAIDADRAATLAPALLGPVLPVASSPGGNLNFSALAVGRPTPSFQWSKNGTSVSGATNPSFSLSNIAGPDAANYSVTATNTAGSVVTPNTGATVWQQLNPATITGSFYGIAHSGTAYATGGDSGLILTSPDAVTWSRITPASSTTYRAFAYGGSRFVAVGSGGGIRYSTDNGATWPFGTSVNSNQLNGVIHDGTRFVAVGASSTVIYSTDGLTWTAGNLGTTGITLNAVAYKPSGNYVAVASNGTAYTTTDVTTGAWTALPTTSAGTNTTNSLNAVAFVNNLFVAVGASGTIRTSATGITWTSPTSPTTSQLNAVSFNSGTYVVTGGNTLVTSTDASTWTTGTFLPVGSAGSNGLIYAGGQFVSVGFPGSVATSATGASNAWTLRASGSTSNYNDAVYANGRYVAVGGNGSSVVSTDSLSLGFNTPVLPVLSGTILRRVTYGAGLFVAVGDSGTILSSLDGTNWANRSFGTANFTALVYAAGKFVAAGVSGAYATSSDGLGWTAGTGTIGTANVTGLAYGGSTPLYVAVNASGGIYTSPDAITWTARTSNTTNALNNVRFVGGQFIALGASSTILTSPDGVTWTHRGLGSSGLNLVDVAHGGGLNVAVHTTSGTGFNGSVFLSTDGITWTAANLGSSNGTPVNFFAQAGIAYGNGSFFVASNNGIVARSLPNTGLQRILTQPAASTTIAAGGSTDLSVTTNGLSGSTYQWYRGASGDTSSPISGATNATYTANISSRYWVMVSGANSPPIASAVATVTGPAPTIDGQPVATTLTIGQSGSIGLTGFANTGGVQPLTFQWRKFGAPIPGATSSTLAFSSPALTDAGYYDVVVSDGLSTVTSKSVRVDVTPPASAYGTVYRPRATAPRIEINSGNVTAIAVDSSDSNKIYAAGEFTRINGTVRLNLARFNSDGSFDSTWAPATIIGGGNIRALIVESDGIIIAGDFTSVGGTPRGRLAKLSKTDGSLLTTFAAGAGASSTIYTLVRQPMADASVRYLVGGSFSTYDGTTVNRLVRVDANGARDTSFVISPTGTVGFGSDVRALLVDGTGTEAKIYVGGTFTSHHGVTTNRNRLVRLDYTGAYDATFDAGSGFNNTVAALALSGTGASAKLYVGGLFTTVNGLTTTPASPSGTITLSRIVRLSATGVIDNTFAVGTSFGSDVNALALDSSGNLYVGGAFTSFAGTTTNVNRLIRLTSAGARDTAFNNGNAGATSTVNSLLLREADGQLLVGGFFTTFNGSTAAGFARVSTAGVFDPTLAPDMRRPGIVYALEPAPAGKWYIGGTFSHIDDVARNHFARLNADGTFDSTYASPGVGFNSSVYALAVQGDGRIVVGGNFSNYAGTNRGDLLRLNADATLDTSFNPGTGFNNSVTALQLLPDGRIVANGLFTTFNSNTTRNRLARILSDGSLDTTFDPLAGFTGGISTPSTLALQSDGKLLVGGTFTSYNGTTANGLVRVLDTGLIDTNYNSGGAGFASNTDVRQLITRLNDQLVAVGAFTTYNGTARSRVARVADTGALDTVFAPNTGANNTVTAFHLQPDDKTILAGFYSSVLGVTRNVFSRLSSTGTLDASFTVPTVVNPFNNINVLRSDASGNLLVGATRLDFSEFLGRGSFVVLEPAPVPVITAPPVAQIGTLGGSATFSVTATGENLQYQWLKNGAPLALPGASTATLALTNLSLADVATYSVTVYNTYGTVTSSGATLSGSAPLPTITAQPVAASGTVGGGTSLTVVATGTGTLGYQWRKFGVPIAGANTATLNLANLGLDAAGYYDVVVNDGLSLRTSAAAQVSVAPSAIANALRPRASFEPRVEFSSAVFAFAPHESGDGRFYAAGGFTTIDGTVRQGVARFLANGSLDTTWTPALITGHVNAIAVQADGKVVIGGAFVYVGGRNSFRLARLNANGTVDDTFELGSGLSGTASSALGPVNAILIQPADQKIIVAGSFTALNNTPATRIVRLNPNGSIDSSFVTGAGFDNTVNALVLQPDGKIVAGGAFTAYAGTSVNRLARLTSTGAFDATLDVGSGFDNTVFGLALQGTDLIVGGQFANYKGSGAAGLVRLSTLGVRDTSLAIGTGFVGVVNTVAVDTGKVIVGGAFTSYNSTAVNRLVRLDSATGNLDTSLNTTLGTAGVNSTVRTLAIQPTTGQLLVGGSFNLINATPRFALARFNANGSLDTLDRSLREPGFVYALQPVANGKFIVGGQFTHIGGVAVPANLARLDTAGTPDATFAANLGLGFNGAVRGILLQGDGKLVVGGAFTTHNAVATGTNRLVRLSADGILDTDFATAYGTGLNGQVLALALAPDGRIVAGGQFTTMGGVTATRVVRLFPTGAHDTAYSTANGAGFNGNVTTLLAHPDGRVSVGGTFTTAAGVSSPGLARLAAAGGIDSTVPSGALLALSSTQTGTISVNALALQPDGRLVVGGFFGSYAGTPANNLLRLTANGGVDPTFTISGGTNTTVNALLLQPDGRLIVGGAFSALAGNRRGGLARLTPTGIVDLSFGVNFVSGSPTNTLFALAQLADASFLLGQTGRQDYLDRVAGGLTLLEPNPASPAILTLPFGAAFPAGSSTFVLGTSVAGSAPFTYQWKRNNVALVDNTLDVTGATTDTLSFLNAQTANAGSYTVTITDSLGASVTTPAVNVTLIESAPVLGKIAANFGPVIQAGTAGYLTATGSGSTATTVAWTKDGSPLSGGYFNTGTYHQPLTPAKLSDAGVYQLSVTNPSGTATTVPTRVWVTEESGWTPHNPLPSPQGLTQLVVANGQFLATGIRGARLTSADGIAWTQLPNLGQNNLLGYLEGNGRRLLIGSLGFVAISTDGVTWRNANLPTIEPVQGSAFGAGLFVVSTTFTDASSGRAKIFTSPDGEIWTERYTSTTGALNQLAYGNGTFALFTGSEVLRSPDGITWTSGPTFTTGSFLRFENGRFFIVSAGTSDLHVSTDALTWMTRSYGASGARGLAFANGQYLLTGDNGLLLTSPDATTWTRRTTGTTFALRNVAYTNNTYAVISNQTFPATILTSTDNGVTWINRTTSVTYNNLGRIATDGTTAMIVPGAGGLILRSTNGTAWSTVTSGVTDDLEGGTYGGGKYVVTGANGRILTSTTGTTWTTAASGTTNYLSDAYYLNNTFLVAGDLGTLVRSTDAVTWTASTFSTGFQCQGLAFGAGRYVAVFRGGVILTSTDAVTWTATPSGTTVDLSGVAYGNGKFLSSTSTAILTSTDGLTWTSGPAPEIPDWDSGAIFLNGRFYAGANGLNGFISSADGVTWAGHHLGSNYSDITSVSLFNGRMYIVGESGLILSSPLAPAIVQQPVGQVAAAGTSTTLRVLAAGSSLPVSYQWRKGGVALPGATSANLSIPAVSAADVGNYDVVVTTSAASVTSAAVPLSLAIAPAIVTPPVTAAVIPAGGTLALQVTASGAAPLTYQWRRNSVELPGASGSSYSKTGFAAADAGSYDVVVTNTAGTVTSSAATVTLAPAAGTLASAAGFTRPDFKQDALAGRVTVDSLGRVYTTWTNGNVVSGLGNQLRGAVIRLNPDGQLDTTFNIGPALVDAWPVVLQSDGKILVGGTASNESGETGFALPRVFRFNSDGTRDFTYSSPHFAASPRFMTLQPDGKLLVVVSSNTGSNGGIPVMARLNADGSLDSAFTQPVLSAGGSIFVPPVVDAAGKIYVGGIFGTINSVSRPSVARLNVDGAVDTTWVPSGFTISGTNQIRGLALQTQGANAGKLLVAGGPTFVTTSASVNRPVIRLTTTGAIDTSFTLVTQADAGMSVRPRLLNALADDRFYIVGSTVTRFLADGAVDTTYAKPNFSAEFFWMDTMADGRVVVPPELGATVNGNPAPTLVRLTATGTVDTTFAPANFNREIYPSRFAVLDDSKLLTWGSFDRTGGVARPGIARFNPNGSLDTAFNVTGIANLKYVAFAEVGSDGKILAGTRVGTNPAALSSGLSRLNPDGTVDGTFALDSQLTGRTEGMEFRLLPDNKVVVWSFSPQGLVADNNFLARLQPAGAVDLAFNSTGFDSLGAVYRGSNGAITSITMGSARVLAHDSSGRLIARATVGSYPANATALSYTLVRVNPDGSRDTTFVAPALNWSTTTSFPTITDAQTNGGVAGQVPASIVNGTPFTGVLPVADGKYLVYGIFTALGGQPAPGIARLTATGAVDPTFNVGSGAQLRYQSGRTAQVEGVSVAADGKIWITGAFDTFGGYAASGLVRLNADGSVDPNFATDISYRTYLGGLAQVGLAPNGTVYVSGTYGRPGDVFPSAFQALVNPNAPVISAQPIASQALAVGVAASFTVAASGADLTYQWRKDGVNLPGATNATYAINSVTASDSGVFDVVVANLTGSVASRPSVLIVSATVALVDQPASRKVAAGATVQFAVSATTTASGATLTYQWRKAGTAIAGATTSSLTLSRVAPADAAAYTVAVGDGTNTVTSQPAVLTVTPPDPVLWQQFTEFSTEQSPARTVHDGAGKVYVPWSVQDRAPDMANGKLVGALARFDENTGELDPTFRLDPRFRRASHVAVQPDGKLLVAVGVGDAHTVVRLTDIGAPDTVAPFNAPLFARGIRFITRQADGKVIVVAADNLDANAPASAIGADAPAIYRLEANGALDAGFTRVIVNNGVVFGPPVVDSLGRIYLAGSFNQLNGLSRFGMARLTSAGALDPAYAVVANLPAGANYSQIRAVALQSDGRAVFVGDFRYTARGTAADRIMAVRFNTDGSFDGTFAQPLQSQLGIAANSGLRLRHLLIQPDDKIIAVSDRVVRLTADGAPDATFTPRVFGREAFWVSAGANGKLYFADQSSISGQSIPLSTISNGIATTTAAGVPAFSFQTGGWGRITYPTDGVVLSDGRFFVAGDFNRIGATPVPGFAFFNADGTPAPAQFLSGRSMTAASAAAAGNDQAYVIVTTPANSTETGQPSVLVRAKSDLTLDSTFVPVLPAGYDLTAATPNSSPGGKLILAQAFISAQAALNGTVGDALIRLESSGARDTGYTPGLSSFATVERNASNVVTMIRTGGLNVAQVLPDGRALVIVSAVDGNLRLLRLTATGIVDSTFNAPSFGAIIPSSGFTTVLTDPVTSTSAQFPITTYSAADLIRTAVQMPDGKVYVGGRFQLSYSGAPRGLARLNADGTLDSTFTGAGLAFGKPDAGPYVSHLVVDAVGRLYVGGRFDSYNGTAVPGLFRLRADGTLDTAWAPGFGVLDAPRADVKLVITGDKLHAFGTVGLPGDTLPAIHRVASLAGAPVIFPATGSGGTTVALGGFGFTGATAVKFNGVDAVFTVVSDTAITATVPALATTGSVTIVTPGGTQTAGGSFTITAGANLVNLSRLGSVGPANHVVLLNFTIESATSSVLLRAAGPALATLGVPGALADPVLTLHDATGAEIARNDDWGGAPALSNATMQVGAFPFGTGSKDAALLANLAPGTYTARVTGAGTGTALAEVYLVAGSARLAHLAARTALDGGGSTAGFFLSGTGHQTVLIRAIGSPLVTALGATDNPSIRVFNSTSVEIAANDNWVASADLAAATAAAGALPLAANDSALLLVLAPGSYTVQTTSTAGTGFVLTEIHPIDSFRVASFKPALLAPLQNTVVSAGAPLILNAPVLAKSTAVTYVWKKDGATVTTGVPLSGSPGALQLPAALATDTGLYTVEMTNSAGTTISAPATVSVTPPVDYSATHAIAGSGGYLAGGTVTITNTLTYASSSGALGWSVVLPPGWSYVSSAGQNGNSQPADGATGTISWAWTTIPSNSVTFTYTLAVPAGETAPRSLTAFAIVRPAAGPLVFTANPNPLVVPRVAAHSADTNGDFRLSLLELTRVIELFNTRSGTVRTGRYSVATTTTEDGFTSDPVTADAATVTLTNYHSADTTRDAKIDVVELTRVIQLYNTRSGTVRTGAYRPATATSEDGYEPVP